MISKVIYCSLHFWLRLINYQTYHIWVFFYKMDPVFYKIYKIWVFYQYGYTDITTFSDPCKEDGSTSITWEPWRSCGERSWASIQCRWSREWCNSRDGCQVKENISRTGWDVSTGSKRRRRLEPWPKVFSSTKSRHWRGEVSRYIA